MEIALKSLCPTVVIIGLDPSLKMSEIYRSKIPQAQLTIGVAEELPFSDDAVESVLCTFGVRNFEHRGRALHEVHRVLKPGGNWGFLEMSAPRGIVFPVIFGFYFKIIMPILGALLSSSPGAYMYLRDSVYSFPLYDRIVEEHRAAGFSLKSYRPILRGAVGLYVFQK